MAIKYSNKTNSIIFNNELAKNYYENKIETDLEENLKQLDKLLNKKEKMEQSIKDTDKLNKSKEYRKVLKKIDEISTLKTVSKYKYALGTQENKLKLFNSEDTKTYVSTQINKAKKLNDKYLQETIKSFNGNDFFNKIINKQNIVKDFVLDYTDYNGINITNSMAGMNFIYNKTKELSDKKNGFLHVIDTETLGATNSTGVWKPSFVTEFAKVTTDFSTGNKTSTNILMTDPDFYTKEFKRIEKALTSGTAGLKDIESDESLRVSMQRFALYGSDKTVIKHNQTKGYYYIDKIASMEDINGKTNSLELIEKGYNKLANAKARQTQISLNGQKLNIKADVKELIDSLASIDQTVKSGTGVVAGYNIQKFDTKTINSMMQTILHNDKNALSYAQHKFGRKNIANGVFNESYSGSILDLQDFVRAYTNKYGNESLIGKELFEQIHGQNPNRQEYLAQALYSSLMENSAHAAIADTNILSAMLTQNMDNKNVSLFDFLMNGLNNTNYENKKINATKGLFMANKGTPFSSSRNVLDFVTDKDNNVYFSSGHAIIDGKVTHSKINMAPSLGIKKNNIYKIEDYFTSSNLEGFNLPEGLGLDLPEYSSGNLHILKLKTYHSDKYKGTSPEGYIYKVFGSEEEALGYINSTFSHVGDFDSNGNFVLNKKNKSIEDRLKTAWKSKNKDNVYTIDQKTWNKLSGLEKLNLYVNNKEKDAIAKKSANYLFGDQSAKRTAQMIDFINEMNNKNFGGLLSDHTSFMKYYNSNGKISITANGKKFTEKEFKDIKNIMFKTLGYKDTSTKKQKLLNSTATNAIASIPHVDKLYDYYTNVFLAMAQQNNINTNNMSMTDIFNALKKSGIAVDKTFLSTNEAIIGQAALSYYNGDYEKAMRAASFAHLDHRSVSELESIYDFKLSKNFSLQHQAMKSKGFNIFSSTEDYFTVDTSKANPTTTLINNITKRYLGKKEVSDATMYKYQREAFSKFITEIDNNRGDYKELFKIDDFNNMIKEVMENPDFDLEQSSKTIIKSINKVKKNGKNLAVGINKNSYVRGTSINNDLAKNINLISIEDIIEQYSKNVYNVMDNNGKTDFVDKVLSNYLFDENNILNHNYFSENDKKRAQRLYNNYKSKLRTRAEDIWDAANKSGSTLSINEETGEILWSNGGKSVAITELDKLKFDNGLQYLETYQGTEIQYHESFVINDKGFLELRTNLEEGGKGGKEGRFGLKGSLTKKVERDMEDGTFDVLDINRHLRNISGYKEAPVYLNFSDKDYILSNAKMDLSDTDRAFSMMMGPDATERGKAIWKELKESGKLNADNYEKYLQSIRELEKGELPPSIRAMASTDIVTILDAFIDNNSPNASTLRDIIKSTASTGKDTDVAKAMFQTNFNNIASTTNLFDNLGRPPAISQLNAKYIRSNTIEGTKHTYENFLVSGNTFQSVDLLGNVMRSMDAGLERVGILSDFTHGATYAGTIGLQNILANEMDRVTKDFDFDVNLNIKNRADKVKELYAKTYNTYVHSTFEQSRVLDSRMIEGVYGSIPQDVQTLSSIKDLEGALDSIASDSISGKRSNKLQDALESLGSIEIDDLGNVTYKKSRGTIVRNGESILRTNGYGDLTSPFSSKFDYGILNFNLKTKQGLELTEKEISQLLTKKIQQQLVDKSTEEADALINKAKTEEGLLKLLLSDLGDGVEGNFEIKNIRDAELVKAGTVDKGMSYLPLTKVGELDETLAQFMKDIGAGHFVGNDAVSSEGIAALTSDYLKNNPKQAKALFNKYNVKDAEELISKMTDIRDIEKHEISRMLFSETGVFKGATSAIVNDNIIGHKNIGMANEATLSKAIELYGKHYGTGSTNTDKYISSLDSIIDLINNNKDFQFFKHQEFTKDSKGNTKVVTTSPKLYRNGTSISVKDKTISNMDQNYILDQEALNKLIYHIDEQLEAKNVPLSDRLVNKDIYVREKDGSFTKKDILGNIITHEAEIDGQKVKVFDALNANIDTRLLIDSEVQSYVTDEYLKANTLLHQKRSELRKAKETGDTNLINSLKKEINQLSEFTENQAEYSNRMKADDQFRNILSAHKIDDTLEHDINHMRKQGRISDSFIDAAREFILTDKDGNIRFKDEYKTNNLYESFIEHLRGLITYDPTKEEQLTQKMIDNIPEYSMYQDLYDLVTGEMGMQLGVDSAQRIHGIQGAYKAHGYNTLNLDPDLERELIDKYKFKSMNMNEFANSFGKVSQQTDSMTNQGFILNLGEDFGGRNKIAVPGLGSVSGNNEIKNDWQKSLSSLSNAWNEYNHYLGDPNNTDDKRIMQLKNNIAKELNNILDSTDRIVNKDGALGRMGVIEMDTPTVRGKLLSTNDVHGLSHLFDQEGMAKLSPQNVSTIFSESFKNKAMINGKTLQEWEKGGLKSGTFFNYGSAGMGYFEKMGFFNDDYLKAANMTKQEMIEHLEKNGTMVLGDRYPNIMENSVQNVRMFLDKNNRTDNAISIAAHTLFNANGDSDGDSYSTALLKEKGIDYTLFDINQQRAKATVDRQVKLGKQLSEEEYQNAVKQETINNLMNIKTNDPRKKITKEDATQIHDVFTKHQFGATLDTIGNMDTIAEMVLPTYFKDEAKNFKLSGGEIVGANVEGMENIGAQVVGGKSILGKVRLSGLQNAPGAFDKTGGVAYMIENTNRVNSLMNDIVANSDKLGINLSDYENLQNLIQNSEGKPLNIHGAKIGEDQHKVLDEILHISELDDKNGKILNTSYDDAQSLIINRIRSDIYNQNTVSKSNKSVIGEVNASLYSVRQASSDIFKASNQDSDSFKDKLIQRVGNELEEHVISSKKKVFEPGDTRLKDLAEYISGAKLPKNKSLKDISNNVSDWMYEYMDESTIDNIYRSTFLDKAGSPIKDTNVLTDKVNYYLNQDGNLSQKQATAKAQSHFIAESFVDSVHDLNSTSAGRNSIKMYGIFGRRSGTLSNLNQIDHTENGGRSFASTSLDLLNGTVSKPKQNVPRSEPYIPSQPKTNPKIKLNGNTSNKIKQELFDIGKDLTSGVSGSGMGLGMLGFAAGLMLSSYASGNPLNDPKNNNMENQPEQIRNVDLPTFFDEQGGYASYQPQQRGYVINIKADSKKGQRYTKKALKQAVAASTGGAVNINMNFKSNNSGGYTDKDIENIISNYI